MIYTSFDEVAVAFEPLILGQIKKLAIYTEHDEFYQIGLIALWEAWEKFEQDKGFFPAYAKMYVRGRMLQQLKKESVYAERHESFIDQDQSTETKEENVIEIDLPMLLKQLSPREQIWLIEFYEYGKKPKEIAAKHGVSVETVKGWRKGAIKKLRAIIKK